MYGVSYSSSRMDRWYLWFLRYVCGVPQVKGMMRKHSELFLDSVDKVKVKVKSLNRVRLFATAWTVAYL